MKNDFLNWDLFERANEMFYWQAYANTDIRYGAQKIDAELNLAPFENGAKNQGLAKKIPFQS